MLSVLSTVVTILHFVLLVFYTFCMYYVFFFCANTVMEWRQDSGRRALSGRPLRVICLLGALAVVI